MDFDADLQRSGEKARHPDTGETAPTYTHGLSLVHSDNPGIWKLSLGAYLKLVFKGLILMLQAIAIHSLARIQKHVVNGINISSPRKPDLSTDIASQYPMVSTSKYLTIRHSNIL